MECLLDGNYWTTFKDRKSRLRDRAEPPPPPPPSVQGRERQTPPTLIVEEEENDSNNKARAKKKVDKPQEDEVESLLDGRYWQTTSNSRRALREKKRAREAQLDSQGEKRAKFDDVEVLIDLVQDEEEEENEDDGEEEKDEEKDEEIESDVEEPSFAPPSVRNLEPLRDLLLEEPVSFWPAMFRDESVSDATCWSRFMALHSEFDLPPDWTSFSMLIKEKDPGCSALELLLRVLHLAKKWKGVMFWMIQHLRPKFERTFDIPSVFLECEDFSNDLPQLPLTNVHHAWLELVHVHLKNNVDGGVNEWLLQDHADAPNLNVVLSVYLVKYVSKENRTLILTQPVVQNLSIVGFCCLLRCLMTLRVDYEILNLAFVARLNALSCVTEELLDWLLITMELRQGELPRAFGSVLACCIVGSLGRLAIKASPARVAQLCFLIRRMFQFQNSLPIRFAEEWWNGGGSNDVIRLTAVFYSVPDSHTLYFKSLGSLVRLRSKWPEQVPFSNAVWPAFAKEHDAEKLDLVLQQLTPSLESAAMFSFFAEKILNWALQDPQRFGSFGLGRLAKDFGNDWKGEYVSPVLGKAALLASVRPDVDFLQQLVTRLLTKSLVLLSQHKDQASLWNQILLPCFKAVPTDCLVELIGRVICCIPPPGFEKRWFSAQVLCFTVMDCCGLLERLAEALVFLANSASKFGTAGLCIKLKICKRIPKILDETKRKRVVKCLKGSAESVNPPFVCDPHLVDDFAELVAKNDPLGMTNQLMKELNKL